MRYVKNLKDNRNMLKKAKIKTTVNVIKYKKNSTVLLKHNISRNSSSNILKILMNV